MDKVKRMRELNELLSKASNAYYNTGIEIMSDSEYDRYYDELETLEKETGIVLSDSRTQKVGYEVVSELKKVKHTTKILSLEKTKDINALKEWLGENTGFLSWKLDGLTLVLTYENGVLVQAVTRGNGETGEDVTASARHIKGIPSRIPFSERLVVRGESLMKYKDFDRVNEESDEGTRYKNPRNLCVGTVRNLDSRVTAERNINFFLFNVVSSEGYEENSFEKKLEWAESLGFQTVYGKKVDAENIVQTVKEFEDSIKDNEFPSDGLVLMLDDIEYGLSLGQTSHAPKNAIAFKWSDETADTVLREVVWSASRTGLLNPIAVFDPVELEGTVVSRALVHNVSIVKQLALGKGDTVSVFKANMIIPQIMENKTRSGSIEVPEVCPVCSERTEIKVSDDGIETLYCTNPECSAKHTGKFEHFVQRDAMNITGISKATIKTFVSEGFLKTFSDFYHLSDYKDSIVSLEGFGERSYNKIIESAERSRHTQMSNVLYALGINNIGKTASKLICDKYPDIHSLKSLTNEQLMEIDGVGEVLADEFTAYFSDTKRSEEFDQLISELDIAVPEKTSTDSAIYGKTFVITGSVHIWNNRNELKEYIESKGGKVTGSVSKKTDYLINNDSQSDSTKNKTAKSLGIPIITEEQFREFAE